MAGYPAFQSQPVAFQVNAFQTGVLLVAGDYSLGSPIFATPALTIKYVFPAPPAYSLGSPSFATPSLIISSVVLHVNAYTLGSPSFATPALRSVNRLSVNAYTLGSPSFATPGITQSHRFFTNNYTLGSPSFDTPRLTQIYPLVALGFSTGSPDFGTVSGVANNYVLALNPYWTGSPSFAFPRLTVGPGIAVSPWPPSYLTQIEAATSFLQGFVNKVLQSIPSTAGTDANDVLRIGNALRVNADAYLRGNNIGGALQSLMAAADKAGATYLGLEAAREYLMSYSGSISELVQLVLRCAVVVTLSSQSRAITKTTFRSQQDAQAMVLAVKQAFDDAAAIGIDDFNDPTVYQSLVALSGATIKHLATVALQLPRYVQYTSDMPMPSLYLANRIYGDGSRFAEIEAENDAVHPAFMPLTLRVLSNAGGNKGEQI
jgi:hypothetical protein